MGSCDCHFFADSHLPADEHHGCSCSCVVARLMGRAKPVHQCNISSTRRSSPGTFQWVQRPFGFLLDYYNEAKWSQLRTCCDYSFCSHPWFCKWLHFSPLILVFLVADITPANHLVSNPFAESYPTVGPKGWRLYRTWTSERKLGHG